MIPIGLFLTCLTFSSVTVSSRRICLSIILTQMNVAIYYVQEYLINPLLPAAYQTQNSLYTFGFLFCFLHLPRPFLQSFPDQELFSIWFMLAVNSYIFYFLFATISFQYFYRWRKDKFYPDTLPQDLSKQVKIEIGIAMRELPKMAVLFMPLTWGMQHGYAKIYYNVADYGWAYLLLTFPLFIFVTDFIVYWAHRILHHGLIYKYIHKPHHTFQFTTPYSSHAFHFVDGWGQGVAYYIFTYMFPTHNILFVVMFVAVNMWTISIHDQVDWLGDWWVMNSTGHHTVHHVDFNYDYGQYFSIWDRLAGTYRQGYKTHEFTTSSRVNLPAAADKYVKQPRKKVL